MSKRDVRLYLADIIESGTAIKDFLIDFTFQDFIDDRKTSSAVIREFEVIGEAVGKLPDEMKDAHPEIEWQDIKDFRNLLIHEYFGIDFEIIWKITQDELPKLLTTVKRIFSAIE